MMALGAVVIFVIVVALAVYSRQDKSQYRGGGMLIKFLYTIFLGIFLATFVGVGIAAFYPEPKYPEQPAILKYCSPDITKDTVKLDEFREQSESFDKAEKTYMAASQVYNRNVSIVALIGATILVIASLTLFRKVLLIADGLLLGGVLTLLYSVIRGFSSEDNMFRFLVVSAGLIISLVLGYIKFIKTKKAESHK